MANVRITIIAIFLLIFISTALVHTVSAQENITKEILRQEDKIVTSQNATFQEFSQSSEVEKENIIEAQRSFDRSLDILNVVATSIGVLVGLLTLITVIAVALGVFEYRKWKAIRKDIEKEANIIRELRNNAEGDANILKNEVEKLHTPITEKPSEELRKKFDELATKLEFIEKLGISLDPVDYFNRGVDFYYKSQYELALKAFEKAIELKSDYVKAWSSKDAALGKLGRYEESLKASEKAIELKPDYAEAWSGKSVALINLGRYEESLKASEKAIELKPDCAEAWHNRACAYSMKGDNEKAISNLKKTIELDISYKELAKEDKDFEKLWDDEDFKKLVE
jgi:tetratricopeptide (TPR) repeat protein